MSRTIVGMFTDYNSAELAARQVKEQGLRTDDISIIAKKSDDHADTGDRDGINDNISDGVISGGTLGGVAGVLLGLGSIAIPGLGIIAAAGPITGLISGAVAGGVIGGLVDLGIPEKESRHYESEIKQGGVLFSMRTDADKVDSIGTILRRFGATSVNIH